MIGYLAAPVSQVPFWFFLLGLAALVVAMIVAFWVLARIMGVE